MIGEGRTRETYYHKTSGYYRKEYNIIVPIYDPMVRLLASLFGLLTNVRLLKGHIP